MLKTTLVAGADEALKAETVRVLQQASLAPEGTETTLRGVLSRVAAGLDVLVVCGALVDQPCLDTARQALGVNPRLAVVVLLTEGSMEMVRGALRSGVADVLVVPGELPQLPDAVQRAVRARRFGPDQGADPAGGGRVLSLYSAKGGSGRSLIASNLAIAMQQHLGAKGQVLLVDLNLQFGGVDSVLDVHPGSSLLDLIPVISELTGTHLANAAMRHPSGLSVLCSPADPEASEVITAEHVRLLLGACRRHYDVVVVDVPTHINTAVMGALEEATAVLYVITPEMTALRTLRAFLEFLDRMGTVERERLSLVINRAGDINDLRAVDIFELVRLPLLAEVRSDFRRLQPLLNRGSALVGGNPELPTGQDLRRLAVKLLG